MNTRVIPSFQTEAEEARWWFDHDDELTNDFEAAADATLEVAATRVLLPNKDADLARTQAAAKGLDYQAYLATPSTRPSCAPNTSPNRASPKAYPAGSLRTLLDLPLNGTR